MLYSSQFYNVVVKHIFISIITCFVFYSANLGAGVSHSPQLDWFTIESSHFRIHYHTGEEQLAKQTANIAERVHNNLSTWIQWQPADKTELVLSDEFDLSNGFATPFPYNKTQLYVSSPDTISSLEDHANWLETLITHEYLHILHLDKAINSADIWRSLFGRNGFFLFNTFPATSLPGWGIEGLATYKETDKQRGIGRGQSSYFDMLMRLEVASEIKPIHQVNQPISSWPMGATRYLYGVNFYQFIEKKYGKESINSLVNNYASNFIPYRINDNTEQVFNKNLIVLWDEFQDYLQKKHTPKIKAIKKLGVKSGTQLTNDGYFDESLTALTDGRFFYVSYDAQRNAKLMLRDGDQLRKIQRVEKGTRLDAHAVSGLLLAQPTLCDNSQYFYDLYRMDIKSESIHRLTHCARYRMASWSPDGKQIIAVHNELGKNELVLLDANGSKIKTLWQGEQWQVVSYMDWSSDGKSLVAAVYREKTGWNLEVFDIKSAQWIFVTKNSIIQNYPTFSQDGTSVYYSAEHNGVYNIFKISLKTKDVTQITNVVGAAFYPIQLSAQGDLFYIGYNENGMDLYTLPVSDQLNQTIKSKKSQNKSTGVALAKAPQVEITDPQDYSPWSSLRPRWWFPVLGSDEDSSLYGISTSGSDILSRHNYFTVIAYDTKNKEPLGSVDYIYDRYWPIFKLRYERSIKILYGSDNKFARAKVTDETQAEMILPFLGLQQRVSAHFALGNEILNDGRRATGVPEAAEFRDQYYGASLIYNNASKHPRSISRNEGRQISLTYEESDDSKDNFFQGSVTTFDWREFIPLGGAHVLAVRAIAGRGETGAKSFRLGGSNNTSLIPPILGSTLASSPFNQREYNLRGYSSGLLALTGNNINVLSTEYRFPLYKLERSFMTPPVGLHELHAAVFYDTGTAWNNTTSKQYYSGAGAEITAVSSFFFHARLNIVLGFAHGFDDVIGENKSYLRLGASF